MPGDETVTDTQQAVTPAALPVDTTDYKAKWEGTKGSWEQEKKRADALAIELSTKNIALEGAELNLTTEVGKHKTAAESAVKERDDFRSKFEVAQQKLEIMQLLNTDEYRLAGQIYNDAASLGTLVAMDEDARKAHLAKVVTTISGLADQKRLDAAAGSIPSTSAKPADKPGSGSTPTVADAKKTLDAVYRSKGPNSPEYYAARDAYTALLMSQGKK